ncbi:hypothetical protein GCM10023320_56760 [Pseudonocardia adelaidensis]|uniref:Uncharacterized protein n=1 Tax=Pseudonocardia adelaidensis TaxID=648754 RepID=A0ABP9NSZ0_9PSEU
MTSRFRLRILGQSNRTHVSGAWSGCRRRTFAVTATVISRGDQHLHHPSGQAVLPAALTSDGPAAQVSHVGGRGPRHHTGVLDDR